MLKKEQIEETPVTVGAVTEAPAHEENVASLYPKVVGGITEWFAVDSNGKETQVTKDGSLNLTSIPALVPVGGAKGTILGKTSGVDHATGWQKLHTLQKEFHFIMPKANTIANRVLATGPVAGLSIYTAEDDPQPNDEIGVSPYTLVIKPVGLTDVILVQVEIMKLIEVGDNATLGWYPLGVALNFKSTSDKTKGAILDLASQLDQSNDILIRVRFFNSSMS